MLNFKIGKTYKDNSGREWVFVSYAPLRNFPYFFKNKLNNCVIDFCEQEGNFVTMFKDSGCTKIPFVEEKEREWKINEDYECYNTVLKRINKVKLVEIDNDTEFLKYRFCIDGDNRFFYGTGEILSWERFVIFKNGVPKELKDRLNKGKLTNKQKCFQKGQIYGSLSGAKWKFIKRAKVSGGLVAIFDQKGIEGNSHLFELYRLNNIELVLSNNNIYLCSDESIRNENTNKAVRVKE